MLLNLEIDCYTKVLNSVVYSTNRSNDKCLSNVSNGNGIELQSSSSNSKLLNLQQLKQQAKLKIDEQDNNNDDDSIRMEPYINGYDHVDDDQFVDIEHSSSTLNEDNSCLLCNQPFNLLQKRRFTCKVCALDVCRNCSICDDPDWICTVCDQQRYNITFVYIFIT